VSLRAYFDLARPFTLVAPALGFVSGALTAIGAHPREPWSPELLIAPLIGSVMAAVLNAGNNALNQIYDLEIDRINKPTRPLTSGRLTISQASVFSAVTYVLALVLAWFVVPHSLKLSVSKDLSSSATRNMHLPDRTRAEASEPPSAGLIFRILGIAPIPLTRTLTISIGFARK